MLTVLMKTGKQNPQYDESVTYGDGTETMMTEPEVMRMEAAHTMTEVENYDGTGTYDDGSGMGY